MINLPSPPPHPPSPNLFFLPPYLYETIEPWKEDVLINSQTAVLGGQYPVVLHAPVEADTEGVVPRVARALSYEVETIKAGGE